MVGVQNPVTIISYSGSKIQIDPYRAPVEFKNWMVVGLLL